MPIRLNRFEMPKRVEKDKTEIKPNFGRYVAEPFEIGYARTIGNALRRVLLSSIEGTAISAVRIQGAEHEFCALPGVMEDVTSIILSLKKVLVKSYTRNPPCITIKRNGPCEITAADLAVEGSVEVLNPHHHIATVGEGATFEMDVFLSIGRGFCPAEWESVDKDGKREQQVIGVIPIDRIYSPVTRVNFEVENTRVGQRTDYERLVLEVTTDGRIDADEAMVSAAAILRRHLDVFVDYDKDIIEDDEGATAVVESGDDLAVKLNMSVNEIELSVRAANCLNNANITTVGQLAQKTEADILKYRNFGRKSLTEIKEKLEEMGLCLGYKFDPALLQKKD